MAGYIQTNNNRDAYLSQYAFEYGTRLPNFIWNKVLAVTKVLKQSAPYPILLPRDSQRPFDPNAMVDDGISPPHIIRRSTGEDTYSCVPKHLMAPVTVDEINNWAARSGLEPFRTGTNDLTRQYHLYHENVAADMLGDAASYNAANTAGAANNWDLAAAVPIAEINTGIAACRAATGRHPNMAFADYGTVMALCSHPDVLELIKYTAPGLPAFNLVMSFFGIKNAHIGMAIQNTAAMGVADVVADIWPHVFGLGYVPEMVEGDGYSEMDEIATARCFLDIAHAPVTPMAPAITREKVELNTGTAIIARWSSDTKVMAIDAIATGLIAGGYLITGTL